MKQKKQLKKIAVLLLAFNALLAVAAFILVIAWGCSLKNTCLLWNNGPLFGWVYLLIFAFMFSFVVIMPAFMICADKEIYFN